MHTTYVYFDYTCELDNSNLNNLTLQEFNNILQKICNECYFENLYYEIIAPNYCYLFFSKSYI